jgi:hypothetical protein
METKKEENPETRVAFHYGYAQAYSETFENASNGLSLHRRQASPARINDCDFKKVVLGNGQRKRREKAKQMHLSTSGNTNSSTVAACGAWQSSAPR